MTRLLTGWRPYRALMHVDRLHEYLLGLLETPKLTKDNLGIGEVNKFIVHIHILIRANTFDDSVMTQLIDSAAFRLLSVYFARTEIAWIHPIVNHRTTDWDVATIIRVLEELYSLRP